MIEWVDTDWLWLAAAGPLIAALAWWCGQRRLRAAAVWASRGLWNRLAPSLQSRRPLAHGILLGLAVALLGVTLARPRWGVAEQQVERRGADVVFVLDTSLSMATEDVEPNRLWIAQTLVRRLVRDLPGHRVALVQAEGDGVVMVPLTTDAAVVDLMLDAVAAGSLPTPGTELAPALDRAAALFPTDEDVHPVIVLLSDGEDHGGRLDNAIRRLEAAAVTVHSIGVGTVEGQPLRLPNSPRDRPQYKRDETGTAVVSRLMEETLRDIATRTDGRYLHATDPGADLDPLVRAIETRATSRGEEAIDVAAERFQWPLGLAVLVLALQLGASVRRSAS